MTSSDKAKEPHSAEDLLKHSLLYRELSAEQDEILRHKWFESEKVGHDVGFDCAMIDWNLKYRSQWRRGRQAKRAGRFQTSA